MAEQERLVAENQRVLAEREMLFQRQRKQGLALEQMTDAFIELAAPGGGCDTRADDFLQVRGGDEPWEATGEARAPAPATLTPGSSQPGLLCPWPVSRGSRRHGGDGLADHPRAIPPPPLPARRRRRVPRYCWLAPHP